MTTESWFFQYFISRYPLHLNQCLLSFSCIMFSLGLLSGFYSSQDNSSSSQYFIVCSFLFVCVFTSFSAVFHLYTSRQFPSLYQEEPVLGSFPQKHLPGIEPMPERLLDQKSLTLTTQLQKPSQKLSLIIKLSSYSSLPLKLQPHVM